MTRRQLDRETKSLYNLVIVATDQARPPQHRLSSTVQVSYVSCICMKINVKSISSVKEPTITYQKYLLVKKEKLPL